LLSLQLDDSAPDPCRCQKCAEVKGHASHPTLLNRPSRVRSSRERFGRVHGRDCHVAFPGVQNYTPCRLRWGGSLPSGNRARRIGIGKRPRQRRSAPSVGHEIPVAMPDSRGVIGLGDGLWPFGRSVKLYASPCATNRSAGASRRADSAGEISGSRANARHLKAPAA
jgi:hypothetical protein